MGRLMLALAAGALLAASPSAPAMRTIAIDIEHSRFVPDRIEVSVGERVRFIIRNEDPIDHEFILGDEELQRIHEEGTEAHHGALPGEVSIPAFGRAETTYVFERPGTLIFGCHLPGHYDYGMKGEARVAGADR